MLLHFPLDATKVNEFILSVELDVVHWFNSKRCYESTYREKT